MKTKKENKRFLVSATYEQEVFFQVEAKSKKGAVQKIKRAVNKYGGTEPEYNKDLENGYIYHSIPQEAQGKWILKCKCGCFAGER